MLFGILTSRSVLEFLKANEPILVTATGDIGDFVGISGEIITTQTGEKTLLAHSIKFFR